MGMDVFTSQKGFYFVTFFLLAVISLGIVYAYNSDFDQNSGNPSIFGHSADEIMVRINGQNITLQKAIESGAGSGSVGGSGTLNVIPKWSTSNGLIDSGISDNGGVVVINKETRISPSGGQGGAVLKLFNASSQHQFISVYANQDVRSIIFDSSDSLQFGTWGSVNGEGYSTKMSINGQSGIVSASDFCTTGGRCLSTSGGTSSGAIALNDQPLYVRAFNDENQKLVYDSGVDGPQLRGNLGGRLTTMQGGLKEILTWSTTGVSLGGDLNLGANKITNLAEPVNSQDAATKNYVDRSLNCSVYEQNYVIQNQVSYRCPAERPYVLNGGCTLSELSTTVVGSSWNNPSLDGKGWECGSNQATWIRVERSRVTCCKSNFYQ